MQVERQAPKSFWTRSPEMGIQEVHYRFSGHIQNRTTGSITLNETELARGTVSLNYVSRKLKTFMG